MAPVRRLRRSSGPRWTFTLQAGQAPPCGASASFLQPRALCQSKGCAGRWGDTSLMGGHLASGLLSLCGLKMHLSPSPCCAAAGHAGGCVHRGCSVTEKQAASCQGLPRTESPHPTSSLPLVNRETSAPSAFPERESSIREVRKCRNKGKQSSKTK